MLIEMAKGKPKISEACFVAPSAVLVGDIKMGKNCSFWFNSTVRGDVMPIEMGDDCNIQDNAVIHGTYKKCGSKLGNKVSVGHSAILHGCEIGDRVLVGMGAIIMDQAKISSDSLVAAGSLVTEGSEFPPGVLIMGRPAKVKRELNEKELQFLNQSAENYKEYKSWFNKGEIK